jgi:recombination protein RecA
MAEEAKPLTKTQKFSALNLLSKQLDKKYDTTNTLIRLGSKNIVRVPSIPLSLPTLDYDVFQFGGIPRGRIIEIYGAESAGKTSITLHIAAEEQRLGGIVAFIDAQHALDTAYAEKLGVNIDDLLINQPMNGEEALQVVDDLVDSKLVSLIIVDDVASLVPAAELAGEIGDAHVGLQSRLMSQACRILTGKCSRNLIPIIFINQIREKIGVKYGNPETTPGGRALKFYSSLRLSISRKEVIGKDDDPEGHVIDVWAVKNKGGVPKRRSQINLIYPGAGRQPGFDKATNMVDYANSHGLLDVRGSWYWLDLGRKENDKLVGVERVANGLVAFKTLLRSEPAAMAAIQKKAEAFIKSEAEAPIANPI